MATLAALSTHHLHRLAARVAREDGLTLIEVVVSALIIALISVGTATALIATAHATGDQQLRSQASALLTQDQERLRGLSAEQLGNLGSNGSSRTVTLGATTYTVTSTSAFQDVSGNSSCSSSATDYFKATSTVSWNETFHTGAAQAQTVSAQSLVSAPVVGDLETSILDQTGAGIGGVTATATPPSSTPGQSTETATSDGSGCAVFTGLAPATYSLTVAGSNYVTTSDASTASQNVTVTAGGTPTTASVLLGQAGTINASFGTYSASASGEANAITYAGAGNTVSSPAILTTPTSPATSASSTFTATNLFPFNKSYGTGSPSYSNNWTVYAGNCSFQQPPTASQTQYSVAPGATTSTATGLPASAPSGATSVQEPFLKLPTVQILLKSVQPTDVVLTYSNGSCTDRYEPTLAAPASGNGLTGVAPANGWLANPGQPYAPSGDLSVCADYASTVLGQTVWYSGTASVANTSMTAPNTVPAITMLLGSRCPGAS